MTFDNKTAWALGSLGAAIGAISANGPKSRGKFFSKERGVASLLGFSAGLALGHVAQATGLQGLGALELSDSSDAPLKFRPIEIVRTDAMATTLSPGGIQRLNTASLPPLPDRLLIEW